MFWGHREIIDCNVRFEKKMRFQTDPALLEKLPETHKTMSRYDTFK